MEVSAEKISEVLSDPESLKQIAELAEMLKTGMADGVSTDDFENGISENAANLNNAANTENEANADTDGLLDGIDFSQILQIIMLLSDPPKDKNVDFLSALKPLMSEEKQPKIERSIKILKLYDMIEILRENGILSGLSNIL
jgi:hypothetical protein